MVSMTEVMLKPVTVTNWKDAIKLSVRDDQRTFVAHNLYSIAQSQYYDSWEPMAILSSDGEMVGFVMWGRDDDPPEPEWWIIRLMVDQAHQGEGYGKAATLAAIEELRKKGATEVYLSFEPSNEYARGFYEHLGFEDTGKIDEGEIVYRLNLD